MAEKRQSCLGWLQHWLAQKGEPSISTVSHVVQLPDIGKVEVVRTLDCIGAACPRPQLLTMAVLEELAEGDIFELLSDNPATVETLPALMFSQGGTHVATRKQGDYWCIYMRKGVFDAKNNYKVRADS